LAIDTAIKLTETMQLATRFALSAFNVMSTGAAHVWSCGGVHFLACRTYYRAVFVLVGSTSNITADLMRFDIVRTNLPTPIVKVFAELPCVSVVDVDGGAKPKSRTITLSRTPLLWDQLSSGYFQPAGATEFVIKASRPSKSKRAAAAAAAAPDVICDELHINDSGSEASLDLEEALGQLIEEQWAAEAEGDVPPGSDGGEFAEEHLLEEDGFADAESDHDAEGSGPPAVHTTIDPAMIVKLNGVKEQVQSAVGRSVDALNAARTLAANTMTSPLEDKDVSFVELDGDFFGILDICKPFVWQEDIIELEPHDQEHCFV
jgi:hypothetical protein